MTDNPMLKNPFKVSKLDAGRRQLKIAIRMWFHDQDPVAIHTLTVAAYEILHSVSKARGRTSPLLLDANFVTPDVRPTWIAIIRRYSNFFKHGDRDPHDVVEFAPDINVFYLSYAISALGHCGEEIGKEEKAMSAWISVHWTKYLLQETQQIIAEKAKPHVINSLRSLSKRQFFEEAIEAFESGKTFG